MEMEEMQQLSKRSRVSYDVPKQQQLQQRGRQGDDDGDGDGKPELRAWQNHASRICRVSRASGGKDRHSKVLTAKGLRDRRVRLSVSTAIQFYDLQDRLGYDQPSKAVEWLIKAASAAIAELPSLDAAFPDLESQLMGFNQRGSADSGPGRRRDGDEEDLERDEVLKQHQHHHQQHLSLDKSACSSTSETSKGSVLSLSRSDSRVKAMERAKERTTSARDKEKREHDDDAHNISDGSFHHNINHDHNSHASFTDLLTGGGSINHNLVTVAHANSTAAAGATTAGFMHKQILHFPPTATTDYFGQAAATLGQVHKPHPSSVYASQPHFPHNSSMAIVPLNVTTGVPAAGGTDHHSDIQPHHPFVQDQIIPIAAVAPGGDYNLNFSISSGLAGFNRGTLQSNSSSPLTHLHHFQRLPSTVDGSNLPFFFGVAGATTTHVTSAPADNHFPTGFDGRLQFCYLDIKGKDKN